jgi:hypothetical protein
VPDLALLWTRTCSKILLGASITLFKNAFFSSCRFSRFPTPILRLALVHTEKIFAKLVVIAFFTCSEKPGRERLSGTLIYPRKARIHCESKRKTRSVHNKNRRLFMRIDHYQRQDHFFWIDLNGLPQALCRPRLHHLVRPFKVGNLWSRPTARVSG